MFSFSLNGPKNINSGRFADGFLAVNDEDDEKKLNRGAQREGEWRISLRGAFYFYPTSYSPPRMSQIRPLVPSSPISLEISLSFSHNRHSIAFTKKCLS